MKLHQSISHLTKQEQTGLRHIASTLSVSLQPALLYCFGIRLSGQLQRSCFTQKRRIESQAVIYDLLIILNDNDLLQDELAATVAKRMIGNSTRANILVHHFSFMKAELLEMDFFFTWAHRSAILLINRNNSLAQLPPQIKKTGLLPGSQQNLLTVKEQLGQAKTWLTTVAEQWASLPQEATLRMVQKAASQVIKALIQKGLGYKATGLSLEDMIKLSENYSVIFPQLFPNNTTQEKKIFSLLIGTTRPGEITEAEVHILFHRVRELKQQVNDFSTFASPPADAHGTAL